MTSHTWGAVKRPRYKYRGKYPKVSSLKTIWKRDKGVCHLCGKHVPLKEATRDHLTPRSHHGSYWPENLKLAHEKCNIERGTKFVPISEGKK